MMMMHCSVTAIRLVSQNIWSADFCTVLVYREKWMIWHVCILWTQKFRLHRTDLYECFLTERLTESPTNWWVCFVAVSSWFLSPVMSGAVSVALFFVCKYFILFEVCFYYCIVKQETHHEMRIPECDVTYVILSVYLVTLIHRYPLNWKQSH